METEKHYSKFEEKKDILKAPLLEGQKQIVYSVVEDQNIAEDIINIIEHTIKSSNSDNKFDIIVEALNPLIQDKAKHIVGKLYIYKRRPCKYNNNCKDENCIYTHDKDNESLKSGFKKRKLEDALRRGPPIVSKSNEVIFNRVDPVRHSEEEIKNYAVEFGTLLSLKKLNESKWLLCFEDDTMAKLLVDSRMPVMGDENIKKYYNMVENLKKFELQSLLEKTESLICKLERNPLSEELRRNFIKIKQLVKEDNSSTSSVVVGKEINKTKINVQSLYFNSF